jgi:hypothetical protein
VDLKKQFKPAANFGAVKSLKSEEQPKVAAQNKCACA